MAVSILLPVQPKTGNKNDTSFQKSPFYVVTKLIPLYLILVDGSGINIVTDLNIIPSYRLFAGFSFPYFLSSEKK